MTVLAVVVDLVLAVLVRVEGRQRAPQAMAIGQKPAAANLAAFCLPAEVLWLEIADVGTVEGSLATGQQEPERNGPLN